MTDVAKKNIQFYGNDALDITRQGDILTTNAFHTPALTFMIE